MRAAALLACALQAVSMAASAAEIPLYPTGPSEDSAFLRIVNTTEGKLELIATGSGASLALDGRDAASAFITVPAGKAVTGSLKQGGKSAAVDITVQPGEFATLVSMPGGGESLQVAQVVEQPDDFNGLKASLAFYNLNAACTTAGLQVAGRQVDIFKDVTMASAVRRSINPVSLSVQPTCDGAPTGEPLALGALQAGERYTVFLVPSDSGSRAFLAQDSLAF